jgi:hypothetical protein
MEQSYAFCLLHARFLLSLLIDPENGGETFSKMLDEFHQSAQSYYIQEDGTLYICIIQNSVFYGVVSVTAHRIFIYLISNAVSDEFKTWTEKTSERVSLSQTFYSVSKMFGGPVDL